MQIFESFNSCYKENHQQIATKTRPGRILDLFHFEVNGDLSQIPTHVRSVLKDYPQLGGVKINISFGYILKALEENSFRFYHPSNNDPYFESPQLISNQEEIERVTLLLTKDNILEHVYKTKLNSSWVVETVACFTVRVYKLNTPPIMSL